jgi:ubiquinone/menaquinone biosynthesis C-methylase UbiE
MSSTLKDLARSVCPSFVWQAAAAIKHALVPGAAVSAQQNPEVTAGRRQDLDVYWTPEMAEILEHWGEGNAWTDVQLLMSNVRGKVLDIACGTGKVMEILARPDVDIFGCDISDLLIEKAVQRGLSSEKLRVCDATDMPYRDGEFDYSYSIGSLEHFTEDGILKFVREASRVTRVGSFHMIPTSRSGREEGWRKTIQSFHNNSVPWWVARFQPSFAQVRVVDSTWNDPISFGKWILCYKERVE